VIASLTIKKNLKLADKASRRIRSGSTTSSTRDATTTNGS
jgi:hypothetical protein